MISLQKLASELSLQNVELIVAGGCKKKPKKNKAKSASSASSVSSSSMLEIEIINT